VGETYLLNHGLELSDAVLKTGSVVFGTGVCLVNLVDAEGGL